MIRPKLFLSFLFLAQTFVKKLFFDALKVYFEMKRYLYKLCITLNMDVYTLTLR